MKDVDSQAKNLQSELKQVENLLKLDPTNTELLAQKEQILAEQVANASSKLEILGDVQGQVEKQFANGEIGADQYRAVQTEIAGTNVKLEATEEELENVNKKASDSSGWETFGKVAATACAAATAALTAVVTGFVELGTKVVESYAEYEQLVGGVETLFGDSADQIEEYANNAYKTAGMSANDYMETVTSFAASLISSLDNDTEAAVEYADMAITDMSDNANKMGTDISSIQSAYQGFAKQNYTMLDNLKLGYGGTKEEMERLLEDAEAISGIEYDIDSYADIVSAIHVIQEEMGVAGATAAEAESTISGSMNSLSAAWDNLLVGLGDSDADIEQLVGNVMDSLEDVVTNITPVVENMIAALPTAIDAIMEILPGLISSLADTVLECLPTLIDSAVSILQSIMDTLTGNVDMITSVIMQLITAVIEFITTNLPSFVSAGIEIITSLITGISEALPDIIQAIVDMIPELITAITDNLPLIVEAGITLITSLAEGLIDAIPQLVEALPEIIESIVSGLLDCIPELIQAGIDLLVSLVEDLPTIIETIVEALPEIIDSIVTALLDSIPEIVDAGVELLISLIDNLPTIIDTIIDAIPEIIEAILGALTDSLPQIIQAGVELFVALIEHLPEIISSIVAAIPQIISSIVSAFTDAVPQIAECGLNLIKGLWNGINDAASWLWDKVSGFCDNLVGNIKSFFGINSPSTLFRDLIGENLIKGIEVGVEFETPNLQDTLNESLSSVTSGVTATLEAEEMKVSAGLSATTERASVSSSESTAASGTVSLGGLHFEIHEFNNNSQADFDELIEKGMKAAEEYVRRKGSVFA